MVAIIYLLGTFIADLLKSRRRLEVENLFLRHQLNITLRRPPQRLRLRGTDRALMVWMTRLWPSLLALARVVQPATILRWHRAGFRTYWHWKSQGRRGRPTIEHELRNLIRRMSKENPLWGAPRIHGELLKLGFEVAESTVSKYMIGRRGPPSQTWRTLLRNHADAIAAIDLCVVPTLTFECLFAFLVVGHGRRQLLWFAVTRHPTAEWLAQQIVEAFPWGTAPTYLLRDNDRAYAQAFMRRLRTMGIRDRPISPRSPWQNAYVERLIGTLRRECLDHIIVSGKRTCAGSSAPMLPTIMGRGPIDLWTRTPRFIAPFSASAPSHHNLSSADFITNIAESDFWYTQPVNSRRQKIASISKAGLRSIR